MLTQKPKKVLSILLALALIFSVGATNIWAASGDVLDPNAPVKLTVTKYLTAEPSTTPGDGSTEPTNANLQAGPNVEFKLTKLKDVDANTSIDNYTKAGPTLTSNEVNVFKGTTDVNGQIIWDTGTDKLRQGFYLLEETFSPYDGTVSGKNPDGILADAAAPSIIALPYANATGYNYDVKVFPKNVGDVNTKTVVNQENVYKAGDIVDWEIKTVISSDKVTSYSIIDTLDSRLDYESVKVAMIVPGSVDSILLTQDEDYIVDVVSNVVTITLTEMGIGKVKENNAIAISTVVTTTINDSAFIDGTNDVIVNNAQLAFNNGGNANERTIPIPTPASITLASVELTKVNNDGAFLEGAQFKIAATEADALAGNFLQKTPGVDLVITTDSNGKASASGIPFAEFTRDESGKIVSISVYLVETQAPAGYDLLQREVVGGGMQSIIAKATLEGGTSQSIKDDDGKVIITYTNFTGAVEVTNYKAFTLPITGGAGTIIFTVVGLIMILSAAFILFKTRRKETAQ